MTSIFSSFLMALIEFCGEEKLIIQLDNASFHKTTLSQAAAGFADLKVDFLPAYFPEGNAIEMVFSEVKRSLYKLHITNSTETAYAIHHILSELPPIKIQSYMRGAFKSTVIAAKVT